MARREMDRDLGCLDAVRTFFASQVALQNQLSPRPMSFWKILSWQMVSGYVWFAISPLILYLARRFPFEDGRWKLRFRSISLHAFIARCSNSAFLLTRLGYPPGREFASFVEAIGFSKGGGNFEIRSHFVPLILLVHYGKLKTR